MPDPFTAAPSEFLAAVGRELDPVTPGSTGSGIAVRGRIVTDFLRPVRAGRIEVTAQAVQVGRSLQLWHVDLVDADGRLVARGRVRLANQPL